MRSSTEHIGGAAPAAPNPSWLASRRARILLIVGGVICATILVHVINRKPAPPPFVPAAFQFTTLGDHIHAEGCFIGNGLPAPFNQQTIDADLRKRTVTVHELSAALSGTATHLLQSDTEYQIVADDGDIVTAISRPPGDDNILATLHIARKRRTVSMTQWLPFGTEWVHELQDGPTIYRRYIRHHQPWTAPAPSAWNWNWLR